MQLWGADALMGIRRELDGQHGVSNLYHMLHEMEARADALVGIGRDEIASDRKNLLREAEKAKTLAERVLAHRTPKNAPPAMQTGLEPALTVILHLAKKYYLLITGHSLEFE